MSSKTFHIIKLCTIIILCLLTSCKQATVSPKVYKPQTTTAKVQNTESTQNQPSSSTHVSYNFCESSNTPTAQKTVEAILSNLQLTKCEELQAHSLKVVSLILVNKNIEDLSPLQGFPQLRYAVLAQNQISDISALSSLTELEYLDLWKNKVSDIDPLLQNKKLKYLSLAENPITRIVPLLNALNLQKIDITSCPLQDLEYFANKPIVWVGF